MLSLYLLCIMIKANNKSWEILFKQMPHPLEVCDFWHTYNLPNITNILYWLEFFEKNKIFRWKYTRIWSRKRKKFN